MARHVAYTISREARTDRAEGQHSQGSVLDAQGCKPALTGLGTQLTGLRASTHRARNSTHRAEGQHSQGSELNSQG